MYYLHPTAFYHFWAGKKYKTAGRLVVGFIFFLFLSRSMVVVCGFFF
jgi:hypothetical protein